ncbi:MULTISPECIES: hypothetical protein [unclassified Sphingomonas]|uniref:hypothetical protein n=1 Tax=unclassified Sphingomonas TaxID=196159 RepID=UPI000E743528|nr:MULTISPECIES: hypothetical protein [unclassified Sphingomonas]RKE53454.1 hypothetical protein C8J39_0599 [Sphingomonas sp. PP-CC-1A-547]TCM09948.1 hypothetical protein C8J41_101455 [Sphingomonas sp. PP-CC-3G-468]
MKTRRGAPLWTTRATRFAGMPSAQARIGLVLFLVFLAACLSAVVSPGPRPSVEVGASTSIASDAPPPGRTDLLLYDTIVAGVRGGSPYYAVAVETQRMGHYPLKPFFAVRLPTLAVVQAALPSILVNLLLLALCVGTILAWVARLRPEMTGLVPLGVAGLLVVAGFSVNLDPSFVVFHEVWAGPLIALSLALRRPGHWLSAVAFGLSAMLIRETALLYVAIMAVFAWLEGERREMLGWLGAIGVFAVVLGAHAHAVSLVSGPLDRVSQGWSGLEGFGFYVRLATISSGLDILPQWLASLVLGTALFGWLAWRDAVATRALVVFAAYAALISLFARSDNFYWALMTTPVLLVGLVFAVDGLRDMIAAARDTRRITVTRIIR